MILNQPAFFARSATLDGAISDTDTQITLSGLSTRFTDAVAAGTAGYEGGTALGPFRISDDDGFELIAITGHVSGTTFDVERGIQGTSEEAWADGTAVRAVVTRSELGQRLQSPHFVRHDSDRLLVYDDFQRPDGTEIGSALTGQTWQGDVDRFQISNKSLRCTSGVAILRQLYVDVGVINDLVAIQTLIFSEDSDTRHGIVVHLDDNNYFAFGDRGNAVRAILVRDGEETDLWVTPINITVGILECTFAIARVDGNYYLSSRVGAWNQAEVLDPTTDLDFVYDNATKIGMFYGREGSVGAIQITQGLI